MTRLRTVTITWGAVAAIAAGAVIVGLATRSSPPSAAAPPRAVTTPSRAPVPTGAVSRYEHAVDAAVAHRLSVWIEADLVKLWRAGPSAFDAGVQRVAALARRPGVAGVKVADELGYHDGLASEADVRAFLTAVGTAMRTASPGTPLLVDLLVPEMGCLPEAPMRPLWATVCGAHIRGQFPQLTLAAVDGYLGLGVIGVLDLSTNLFGGNTYAGWGTDRDAAQRAAWREVQRRGWPKLTTVQARKALAHPGAYTGGARAAGADVRTWVDLPLAGGAAAVDIWAWRQAYRGQVNRLLDPGLRPNALWQELASRRRAGSHLFTHFSPNSVEVDMDKDLALLATVFTGVFIAAGTG
jgi:hypothetical protein